MKTLRFLKEFLSYMSLNKEYFPFLLPEYPYHLLNEEELLDIVVNQIDPVEYFSETVKICMRVAYDSGVNIEYPKPHTFFNKEFGADGLQAKRHNILYPLSRYVERHLIAAVIRELAKRKALKQCSVDNQISCLKIIDQHIALKNSNYRQGVNES